MPSFVPSTVPDITETIPAVVSARTSAATVSLSGIDYDVAFAGIGFLLAASPNNPYLRQTADPRKQQFDSSKEAGEQSLDQSLWTRSQASWHMGANIAFYEPTSDPDTEFRFSASSGVDVWTQGQASLLHSMVADASAGGTTYVASGVVGGVDVYFCNANGTLSRRTPAATAYTGSTSLVGAPVVAGSQVVVGASGQLWQGSTSGTTLTTFGLTGVTGNVTPYWAKNRLMAVNNNSIYMLTLASSGALSGATWSYTHPDANWTWTSVTESVDAILAAGYSNGYGAIFRFSLTDAGSGTVPILGQAYQIAEMPPGEQVYSIKAYLGKYIAIGTSLGLRIGIITGATSISPTVIQYGPLTVKSTTPVTCLTARDSYVFAGVQEQIDGMSGAVRVDLQQEVTQGSLRFPYAYDANAHITGVVSSICFLGTTSRVVLAINGTGSFVQSTTAYETTGYITSGKVRYDTSELKAFRLARIRATYPDSASGVALATVSTSGSVATIIRITGSAQSDDFIALSVPAGQFEYMSFMLTLSGDGTHTPTLASLLIKALPAPQRAHVIQFPLMCLDHEMDSNNTKAGTKGYALQRLQALEALESAQAIVVVKDFNSGESFDATIEKISFQRTTNPSKGQVNFGGTLVVQVRKYN